LGFTGRARRYEWRPLLGRRRFCSAALPRRQAGFRRADFSSYRWAKTAGLKAAATTSTAKLRLRSGQGGELVKGCRSIAEVKRAGETPALRKAIRGRAAAGTAPRHLAGRKDRACSRAPTESRKLLAVCRTIEGTKRAGPSRRTLGESLRDSRDSAGPTKAGRNAQELT
jgi:hypothetical protein